MPDDPAFVDLKRQVLLKIANLEAEEDSLLETSPEDSNKAKHRFAEGVTSNGYIIGARCVRCGQIVLFEDLKIPEPMQAQECPRSGSDTETSPKS